MAKHIEITFRENGHAHTRLSGTCAADVTPDDIRERFFNPYLGGRDVWVRDGKWGCIVHND